MRQWILIIVICIIGSCGSDEPAKNGPGKNGTGNPAGDTTVTHQNGYPDTLVWVGIFARWLYNEPETYDGSYDTVTNIFVMCSNNQAMEVPREQIKFQASGFCDTAAGNRIKLMIRKSDSVKIITNQLKVIDRKGIYKVGNEEKTIRINDKALDRIRKTGIRSASQLQGRTSAISTVNRKDSLRNRTKAYLLKDSAMIRKALPNVRAQQ